MVAATRRVRGTGGGDGCPPVPWKEDAGSRTIWRMPAGCSGCFTTAQKVDRCPSLNGDGRPGVAGSFRERRAGDSAIRIVMWLRGAGMKVMTARASLTVRIAMTPERVLRLPEGCCVIQGVSSNGGRQYRHMAEQSVDVSGYLYGLLGIVGFGLTLPATRAAVAHLNPIVVGLGRSLVAALLAGMLLAVTRQPFPQTRHLRALMLVGAGAVIGFPVLTTLAMQHVDASHGAVVLGLLPLFTALFGSLVGNERPSRAFWVTTLAGTVVVVWFLLFQARGAFKSYDVMLLAGAISAAMSYAVGAQLAKEIGAWQVISWALLLATPALIVPVGISLRDSGFHPTGPSLAGFLYVSGVSMLLAYVAWYKGLVLVGTAKAGLLQLLQPFVTIAASAALLHEHVSGLTVAVAGAVALVVFIGQRTRTRARAVV